MEILEQSLEMHRSAGDSSGVEARLYVHPLLRRSFLGDAARLQQVIVNLVGNAFKFTTKGEVAVEVYPLRSTRTSQIRAMFVVTDTGPGIPDEKINILFKPFTQVSEGYKRSHQGAGLGLSICKRLVELMGGVISYNFV